MHVSQKPVEGNACHQLSVLLHGGPGLKRRLAQAEVPSRWKSLDELAYVITSTAP